MSSLSSPDSPMQQQGFWMAFGSYAIWGIFPLYFYWLKSVSPTEVLAHRVLWSAIMLIIFDIIIRPKTRWFQLIRDRRALMICASSGFVLMGNWLVYIWAVGQGRALEGSLGYYINPIISIILAMLFLGERMHKMQIIATVFASIGVAYLIWQTGELPWVSLVLAMSFGLYGLIRKANHIDAFAGLTVEQLLAAPVAIAYLGWLMAQGEMQFLHQRWNLDVALLLSGVVTTLPLLLFLASLPHLSLVTIGLLQYIAPTLQFFVAIYLLGEPFDRHRLIAFGFIWLGLIILSVGQIRRQRRATSAARKASR